MTKQLVLSKILTMPTLLEDPLITTFGRLVEVYSRLERTLGSALEAQCDLPHVWFEVLLRLGRSPDGQLTMSALRGQIALTSGGVTRLIDRMVAAGLVERRPCASDRRVQFAGITDRGRRALENAAEVHIVNLHQVFAGFNRDDLATLDSLLDRLRPDNGAAAPG